MKIFYIVLQNILPYEWLENSLKSGEKIPEDSYTLKLPLERESDSDKPAVSAHSEMFNRNNLRDDLKCRRIKSSMEDVKLACGVKEDTEKTGDLGYNLGRPEPKDNVVDESNEVQTAEEPTDQTRKKYRMGSMTTSQDVTTGSKDVCLEIILF